MARSATGLSPTSGGYIDIDPKSLMRGGLQGVFFRDARGAATDISPHNSDGSVKWSPFALDGELRPDMFAHRLVNGIWKVNPDSNEGFFQTGSNKKGEGPERSPKIDVDRFEIEQSNYPFDFDIVSESQPFSFTAVETIKPVLRRLRNNLALNGPGGSPLVELPGAADAGWSTPLISDPIDRQVLLWHSRRIQGKSLHHIIGFSLAKLSDIGTAKMSKTDSDAAKLTYEGLPDGIFMAVVDGEYQPIIVHEWVGGKAWAAMAGGPSFGGDAPVATATGTGAATVAFATPTGGLAPYTYTAEVKPGAGSWTAAVLNGAPATGGGTTTVTLKSLAAGASKFRATVTDANNASATSAESNTVTVT